MTKAPVYRNHRENEMLSFLNILEVIFMHKILLQEPVRPPTSLRRLGKRGRGARHT